jgi:hypothetical protein
MKPLGLWRPIEEDELPKNLPPLFVNEVIQFDQIDVPPDCLCIRPVRTDTQDTGHCHGAKKIRHLGFPPHQDEQGEPRQSLRITPDEHDVRTSGPPHQGRFEKRTLSLAGQLFAWMLILGPAAIAQESQSASLESRPLESVPPPPPEMTDLVRTADVRFEFGPEDSPKKINDGTPMAAETSYRIAFEYRSKLNWKLVGDQVIVRIRITDIQWKLSHIVWFRVPPDAENFWDNPLVRHEIDHVRISTDSRLQAAFRRRVDEVKTTRFAKSELGDRSLAEACKEKVRDELTSIFKDTTSLAEIRYRELDRVTRHGLKPLPDDADQTIWDYKSP